jgi:hypothetical protein
VLKNTLLTLYTPNFMNALERNIQFLWNKRDVSGESWLCLYSFRSTNIHIRIVKGDASGQYFVSCASPHFQLKGYDLRKLLILAFADLQGLTNDPYHRSTIRRILAFFEKLKNEPQLMFAD